MEAPVDNQWMVENVMNCVLCLNPFVGYLSSQPKELFVRLILLGLYQKRRVKKGVSEGI